MFYRSIKTQIKKILNRKSGDNKVISAQEEGKNGESNVTLIFFPHFVRIQ